MLAVIAVLWPSVAVRAQDDTAATPPAAEPAAPAAPTPSSPRVNVLVTVPRVNAAQARECVDQADASTISGEIVVCRDIGDDGSNALSESRKAAQKRYAQETAYQNAPRAPIFNPGCKDQGNPPGCISGFGKVPPPALLIDVEALPQAPAGSDADRIARGLPPLGRYGELSEEEEKARREALGIKTTVPPPPKKKGG
jgi:hypothetical protein